MKAIVRAIGFFSGSFVAAMSTVAFAQGLDKAAALLAILSFAVFLVNTWTEPR